MATKPITTPQEFAAALATFTAKWGERLIVGTQKEWLEAALEAKPLAKYGKVRVERILEGAAAKWLREGGK